MKSPANLYEATRQARRVLVIDPGMLGDTIHLLPALWELRRHYREAELHAVCSPVGSEVLQLAGCVDRLWVLEQAQERRRIADQLRVLLALRRMRFDLSINFGDHDRNQIHAAIVGARLRVAQRRDRRHVWSDWCIPYWVQVSDSDQPAFEQRRQMLAACGLALAPPQFGLKVHEPSLKWAAGIVSGLAMHVSVNSSKPTREWPIEHHAALLRTVWAEQPALRVLASASANERERERLRALAASVNDQRLQLLPELTIPQLAAVLARCQLHLGPDSGVLHLAVALNVPTISFFREQGSYKSFMPVGSRHRVISVPCRCVDHRVAPCEGLGRSECFAGIEPARVAALVREQLAAWQSGRTRDTRL